MPIFVKVESKSFRGRLFNTATIIFLSLGGLTMIYPFLIMISGSFRSAMDENDLDLVPEYFYNVDTLYGKFLEFKYDELVILLNRSHLTREYSFRHADVPDEINEEIVRDFRDFFAETEIPAHWQVVGGMASRNTVQENLRKLRDLLSERFDGDLNAFSESIGTAVSSWLEITFRTPEWISSRYLAEQNVIFEEYLNILEEAPLAERTFVSLSGFFLELVVYPRYGDVETFNEQFNTNLDSFHSFRIPRTAPDEEVSPLFLKEWTKFIQEDINVSFVVLDDIPPEEYRRYLEDRYRGEISQLNLGWESDFGAFSEIGLPAGEYLNGAARQDYKDFLRGLDPGHYRLVGPEFAWKDWLEQHYADIASLNQAHRANYDSWRYPWIPYSALEMEYTVSNKWELRGTFALRNFINVANAIFVEGRVFLNTVIFTSLSVLLALLINPLAAYAMSRFKLPGSYKILLVFMAVMAFPPMVTTIPVFIMMQNLGLMNTFAGLLMPTIANGYLIFLLKGFFDSLPRELYEAAQIEGASELRMFFKITMALSKPILAVVALQAFNASYTIFLFALIIAPEQDMWLMPVWLYQYRETVSMGGVFASVLLASIPPIVIFLFAQKIILRGIVVPVEK